MRQYMGITAFTVLGSIKMCFKRLIFLCILALSLVCGIPAANASSGFSATTIRSVVIHDFGDEILFYLPASVTNNEGCTYNHLLVVPKTHPFFKEIYAAGLSTFQANGTITGWVHGCSARFHAPVLIRLDLIR